MSDYKDRKHTRYSAEPNELVTIIIWMRYKKTEQRVGLCQNESLRVLCRFVVE